MVGVDGADDALAGFVGVDVHGVEVLADVVEGFQFWVDGGADVGLDAEILVRALGAAIRWGTREAALG